jgi:putative transcriptional regulator
MKKRLAERLLESLADAVAHAEGDTTRARLSKFEIPIDVKKVRKKSGLSQEKFSEAFGINTRTLQEWEQGRRTPSGAARTLIAVIDTTPHAISRAMQALGRTLSTTKNLKRKTPLKRSTKKTTRNLGSESSKSRIKKNV